MRRSNRCNALVNAITGIDVATRSANIAIPRPDELIAGNTLAGSRHSRQAEIGGGDEKRPLVEAVFAGAPSSAPDCRRQFDSDDETTGVGSQKQSDPHQFLGLTEAAGRYHARHHLQGSRSIYLPDAELVRLLMNVVPCRLSGICQSGPQSSARAVFP